MTKKIIYIGAFLLFCFQVSFGQAKTENKKGNQGMATGDYKPNRQQTPPKKTVTSESRSYQNECYKNFAFSVKNYDYNKDGKFYSWGVTVKNNYSKSVQLKYKLIVGNDNTQNGTLTYYIKPGETYSNDMGTAKAIIVSNNSDQYKIDVSEVCFEGQDCYKNGYADCNGNQVLKIASSSTNNSNIQTNNTTGSTTPQNDLTEYNRSKAEMEQKLADENARIQRQNQENVNKLQVYNNAIKAGVAAHNSGNYTEAKNQFTVALNNSTNQQNRQMAQEYYNKTVSLEKDLGKVKAIGDFTTTTINAIDQYSKANRERKIENEKITNERIDNDMKGDIVFSSLVEDVSSTFQKAGYILNKIGNKSETISTTSTVTKTQSLYFDKFELFIMFSIYELKAANFGRIMVISNYKEEWEKIRDSKILNKWEKDGLQKYKFQNAVYTGSLSGGINIDFESKVIKNYKTSVQKSSLYKPEKSILGTRIGEIIENTATSKGKEATGSNVVSQKDSQADLDLSAEQLFLKGKEYYSKNDFQKAYQFYENSSKKGYSEAMTQIGRLFVEGNGVTKDYKKAMEWYLKAVKNGSTDAMVFIAYLYEEGKGVFIDYNKAMEWLLKASDMGDASAMYEIGVLYDDGEGGVEQSSSKAFDWYLKAANKGNKNAMYNLASKYQNGEGVNFNIDKAKEWFQKACNLGKTNACERLKKLE